jgi:hypothetical protein
MFTFLSMVETEISRIDIQSGMITQYDIPTGPLSTAVFITVSDDGHHFPTPSLFR